MQTPTLTKPRTEWVQGCMALVEHMAKLSRCSREDRDVCCAIISTLPLRVLSIAVNAPSHNLNGPDAECPKYSDPCGCTHAEIRAVARLQPTTPLHTLIAVCNMAPCLKCAQALVATDQIHSVVCPDEHPDHEGIAHLVSNGIYVWRELEKETEALRFEQYAYECEQVGALRARKRRERNV